jgi:2,3-dihydroxybenzoate-AMP ligase
VNSDVPHWDHSASRSLKYQSGFYALADTEVADVGADTVYLVSLPAGHSFPLACPGILGTLLAGGRAVTLPSAEPARWREHAADHGSAALAGLRVLRVGGARLADELAYKVKPVLTATLQQVFGMAEGLLNYTRLDDPDDIVCTTQGRPRSRTAAAVDA